LSTTYYASGNFSPRDHDVMIVKEALAQERIAIRMSVSETIKTMP
jgi:hypothetical protein